MNDHWLLSATIAALLVLGTEVGFLLGRRAHARLNDSAKSQVSTIQAAILGLLGLLLGFTFAMAATRFDSRKQLVLEEANAIGTTALRARLLPEPHRTAIEAALARYVDARLAFFRAGTDEARLRAAEDRSAVLQRQIWEAGGAVAERLPRAVVTGLFLESLNEMIDLDAKRLAALENHVPETIWLLLGVVALLGVLVTGYGSGLGARRNLFSTAAMPIVISIVIAIIVDLDRPRRGLIRVSQTSLERLAMQLPTPAE